MSTSAKEEELRNNKKSTKCTYIRANSCHICQSLNTTSKLSSLHSRAMELEVKIFFISDMLMVDVWKDLMGDVLREVEIRVRGIDL